MGIPYFSTLLLTGSGIGSISDSWCILPPNQGFFSLGAFLVQLLSYRSRQITSHILIAPIVDRITFQRLFERSRKRELIDRVNRRPGDDDLDSDILERGDASGRLEQTRHAIALKRDARKFGERLDDIKVAKRRHFEESHVVLSGVMFRQCLAYLTLVGEVKTITHENLRYTRSVFVHLF